MRSMIAWAFLLSAGFAVGLSACGAVLGLLVDVRAGTSQYMTFPSAVVRAAPGAYVGALVGTVVIGACGGLGGGLGGWLKRLFGRAQTRAYGPVLEGTIGGALGGAIGGTLIGAWGGASLALEAVSRREDWNAMMLGAVMGGALGAMAGIWPVLFEMCKELFPKPDEGPE